MSSEGEKSSDSSDCFYDCSKQPDALEPYGDIGGIGVSMVLPFHRQLVDVTRCN